MFCDLFFNFLSKHCKSVLFLNVEFENCPEGFHSQDYCYEIANVLKGENIKLREMMNFVSSSRRYVYQRSK